jgi:hypothetical protein
MSLQTDNLAQKLADQVPKGGTWLLLKNIELAIHIAFNTLWESIKLFICLIGLYYLITIMPPLEAIYQLLGTN